MNWFWLLLKTINILLYVVLLGTWLVISDQTALNLSLTIFNLSLSVLIGLYHRKELKALFKSTQASQLASSLMSVVLLFFVLSMINYLFLKNPIQYDISKQNTNSLTPQSQTVIRSLPEPLTFKIFSEKSQAPGINALLNLYRLEKDNINIEFYDIQINPLLIKKYNITRSPTIILQYQDSTQHIQKTQELDITNALIKINRKNKPIIFFTTNHGEMNLYQQKEQGASILKDLIEKSFFQIQTGSLNQFKSIPPHIDILAIWGPRQRFFKNEIKVVEEYLQRGGKLILALDLNLKADNFTNLKRILKNRGIIINNDLVIDRLKFIEGSFGTVPIIETFSSTHPITKNFNLPIFFPLVSSLESKNEKFELIAYSTPFPASWAERTPGELAKEKIVFDKKDRKGPMGVVGTFQDKEKIAIFGNSTFISNVYSRFTNNFTIFLNTLSWLNDDEGLISFNLPSIKEEPLFINSYQIHLLFYLCVLLPALLIFFTSFYFYWSRKK